MSCPGKISNYKVPKYVTFVRSYPLTGSGKVQKYRLREEAARLFAEAVIARD
jgi:fatty-acyl-CoA synthase